MAAMTSIRWGAFRSVATALRSATRSGAPGPGERLAALPRLVGATLRQEYAGADGRQLLLVVGAMLYVVSPVDLMPEAVLSVLGLGDDAIVVTWVAAVLVNETDRFLDWERQRARTVPGDVIS